MRLAALELAMWLRRPLRRLRALGQCLDADIVFLVGTSDLHRELLSATRAEISNSVVVSMTRIAPMSDLSMPPRRQIIGNNQRASAFLRLPIEARNQTLPSPMA